MQEERKRWIYSVLDVALAGVYLLVVLHLVPSRSAVFTAVGVGMSLILVAAGVGMLVKKQWARQVALSACLILLLLCVVLIGLLLFSAAYLHGIYDGIGEAGSAIAILVALLVIEVVGLLPALQLAFLLRQGRPQD